MALPIHRLLAAYALSAVLLLGACAVQTQALREHLPAGLAPAAELSATPFFPQTEYQCGPAALATALGAAGMVVQPAVLGTEIFLPAREGTLQTEMLAGARRHGAVATLIPANMEALMREVAAGHPVVVLQNLGLKYVPMWHYAVVIGYDLNTGDAILRSGTTQRELLPLRTLEHTWARSGYWGFVALPAGSWPATVTEPAAVEAAVGFERAAPPKLALQAYESASQRWPGNLTLSMGVGNTAYASGDKSRAAAVFRATASRHRNAAAWINLANVLLELGLPAQAEDAAREAIALKNPAWQAQAEQVLKQALAATREKR